MQKTYDDDRTVKHDEMKQIVSDLEAEVGKRQDEIENRPYTKLEDALTFATAVLALFDSNSKA